MNTSILLNNWYERKVNKPVVKITNNIKVTETFKKQTCGLIYAKLSISVTPEETLIIKSNINWNIYKSNLNYERAIIDGILDELLCGVNSHLLGMKIVIEDVDIDIVASNSMAFYIAARNAAKKIKGDVKYNISEM